MSQKRNITLFYWINFFQACLFKIPIWYFFFVNFLNFWIGDAILINTFSWLVSLFFEVHSWWWADRLWRKRVYILGLLFLLFWFSFYLWATQVYLFLISAWFIWLWYALTSWNLEALIHDWLEESWEVEKYNKIQSNQYIILFIWRAISSLIAGYLFIMNEYYPFIATIICYIIATLLIFFIRSPKQEISQEVNNFKHIKKALSFLLENKKQLYIIIFLWFIFSWIWNIYWFTYQPYLEFIWLNIKDIWIIYFFISIFSAFWSYIIKNIQDENNTFSIFNIMFLLLLLTSIMFSIFTNLMWLLPIIILSILFWFVMILWNNYLIKSSPKTHKSTILSIFSFAGSLWYFLFWSIAWYLVEIFSLENVYNVLPFIITIFFVINIFYFKKTKQIIA